MSIGSGLSFWLELWASELKGRRVRGVHRYPQGGRIVKRSLLADERNSFVTKLSSNCEHFVNETRCKVHYRDVLSRPFWVLRSRQSPNEKIDVLPRCSRPASATFFMRGNRDADWRYDCCSSQETVASILAGEFVQRACLVGLSPDFLLQSHSRQGDSGIRPKIRAALFGLS